MAISRKEFDKAVRYYQRKLELVKKKDIFVLYDSSNKNAYYSIAPLSRAAHNLGKDLYVMGHHKDKKSFLVLHDIWEVYKKYKKSRRMDEKTATLIKFIETVDKKTKGNFKTIFEKPQILEAGDFGFNDFKNRFSVDFRTNWIPRRDRWNDLLKTSRIIWDQVYDLKKNESVSISFELIPKSEDMDKPLEDLLGSYLIADAMFETSSKIAKKVKIGASTHRYSMSDSPENVSELIATLTGCEYDKDIDEDIFILYKNMSEHFGCSVFEPVDASFGIFGKGTHGKHMFGEAIGYPTANKKNRWEAPGRMFYKFAWSPQSKDEPREPQTRIGFTDTIPIKDFIETCKINWYSMHKKNQKITDILDSCEKIIVAGEKTNLIVQLKGKGISRRYANNSDIDIRTKIDKDNYVRTGLKTGTMANLPGGESFITPEYIEGTLYGDVVINIDDSYPLDDKNPLIITMNKNGYSIEEGPKKIVDKLVEKKKEAWEKIIRLEKAGAVPKKVTERMKTNFNGIGEFAINTNPNAKLGEYLIVNEKIADMMHIALGSGFDADKNTTYHYDIVFNSKEQKLDVYGVLGVKKRWIIRKGKMII